MGSLDDILRRAKRLGRHELSRLIKQLDEHLSSGANGHRVNRKRPNRRALTLSRPVRPKAAKKRPHVRYARTLALSGTAHSGSTDVSSHKGKYLAAAYAPRR